MTLIDLVRLFAEPLSTAVLLTDTDLERPGPTILYADPAFEHMSGYRVEEVYGNLPRMLQGAATNRQLTRLVARHLRAKHRFYGVLENYRKSGEGYLCEIDVRPILGTNEEPIGFLAFEREVVRQIGRPVQGASGRYRPIAVESFVSGAFWAAPTPFS
ncbi:MAG: PAS domain S-box protein [Methylorubrum rhodinum]|uniref:PAS domain S-box protein n=1 Tax=Methylorubrum rhodinum TaxID=29428 RepID=UPI003BAEBB9B